eukprot:TRINITY_DN10948_c0_g1_i1.p1 TRINITY_DN10948_c0_g1~~TRINITY_DN10948_c0_g1_i1.p1  ORF type:complete len:144 (+),score=29.40 TRINITY_DN10948_c0_g1_i1:23-433(+)
MDESLTFQQFVESYQHHIISVLVKSQDLSTLKDISDMLNTQIIPLIHRHFGYIYCQSFCLLDDRSTYTKGDVIISSFLCKSNMIGTSPDDKIKKLLSVNHTALLVNIIDYYAVFILLQPIGHILELVIKVKVNLKN